MEELVEDVFAEVGSADNRNFDKTCENFVVVDICFIFIVFILEKNINFFLIFEIFMSNNLWETLQSNVYLNCFRIRKCGYFSKLICNLLCFQ